MILNGTMPGTVNSESSTQYPADETMYRSKYDTDEADVSTEGMMESENKPLICDSKPNVYIPEDRFRVVYAVFYLLGIGSLLPFNFFSTARQYFVFKLRTNTTISETEWVDDPSQYNHLQAMFVPYLTMAAMVPNVLFMLINTALTKILRLQTRIMVALLAMFVMFFLTVLLTKINTDNWQSDFFVITMVTIVIMNAGSAVLQGGIIGLSSMFPKEYTQSVMSGMGMGGVIAACANICAIWFGGGPLTSGFGYFLTAELVVVIAMVGFLSLRYFKYARHYSQGENQQLKRNVSINEEDRSDIRASVEVLLPVTTGFSPLVTVFKKIWLHALSVFFIFLITLACFPAVNSRIFSVQMESKHPSKWALEYFIPVICFLLFNVSDFVGRTLAGLIQFLRGNSMALLVLSLVRVVFIPLFLLCNILPRHHLPLVFHNDYTPIILMLFFGVSNGYLGTLCMMYGPRVVDSEDMELAGSMMSLFLSSGLAIGSALSFLIVTFV